MSNALAISVSPPPPAPRGVQWIDVKTAAKRMNVDERTITRRCGAEWAARGLAKCQTPADGRGKAEWTIREDADALLGRVLFPEQMPIDKSMLTHDQIKLIKAKAAILTAFNQFGESDFARGLSQRDVEAHFLKLLGDGRVGVVLPPKMSAPSDRTLRNWKAAFRRDGLSGLIDERVTRQKKPVNEDPFFSYVKELYLDLRCPSVQSCWEAACLVAGQNGWMPRSYKQTTRFLGRIPRPALDRYRGGKQALNDRSGRYIERDYSGVNSNDWWCADHHEFDVIVVHRGKHVRPWLTAFQDIRSRKIVGWSITANGGNTDTILEAFDKGIASHGVPVRVYFDNGSDFASTALVGRTKRERRAGLEVDADTVTGVFSGLQIGITHCWPYHGQSKPIERFFGTLEDRFGRTTTTYCGNSPANRPEDLDAKLAKGMAPTLEELTDRFAAWLEGDYHTRIHEGDAMDGRSPADVFTQCLVTKRTLTDAIRSVFLWKPSRPTAYTRAGILCNGIRYGATAPELYDRIGKRLIIRVDPADANRAAVCELSGSVICFVNANQKLPFGSKVEELREAIAATRRDNKRPGEHRRRGPRIERDVSLELWAARLAESEREKAAKPPTPGPTLSTVCTPMDDQLPLLEKALKQTGPRLAGNGEKLIDLVRDAPDMPLPEPRTSWLDLGKFFDREREEREAAETPARTPFRDMVAAFQRKAVGDE
jgi:transposase InsO family protein